MIDTQVIEGLLALSEHRAQVAFLAEQGLLDAAGLTQLLDRAAELVRSDPGQARRLATVCAKLAAHAAAPAALPRSQYISAQTYALNGDLERARELIERARAEYLRLGDHMAALRTNVGLMHVLNELGHHQEALAVGQQVLGVLHGLDKLDPSTADPDAGLLSALVQQNIGVCYENMGRYAEALSAYQAAEEGYAALQMDVPRGHINNNRGVVLLNLGRAGEALRAFETAATIFAADGAILHQAQALINSGNAHLLLGNYTRSLEDFATARRLLDTLEARAEQHILLLDTANAYLALNLYPEALASFRQAIEALQDAGMVYHRARALWGLGATLLAVKDWAAAGPALAEAADLFAAAGNVPLRVSVMLEQAALQAAQDQREAALATVQDALALLEAGPAGANTWPVQIVYAHLRSVDLLLPDVEAAEAHLLAAQPQVDALGLPHLRYRLRQRLGHVRLLQGRDEEACQLLEAAVDDIECLRAPLAQEAVRTSFLQDKTAVYEDLMRLYLSRGDEVSLQRAFAVAEQAKSRTLVELLSGIIDTSLAAEGEPEVSARLRALQADLNAIYNQLLGSDESEVRSLPLPQLLAQCTELEQEISRLRLEQRAARAPQPDIFEQHLSLDAIAAQLPAAAALLIYHIVGDEIMAFVIAQGQLQVVRRLSTVATVQQWLDRLMMQWERFRPGREFVARHLPQLERSTRRVLAALYAELVAPLEAVLAKVMPPLAANLTPRLVIVPHGLLHHLPFHATFDGEHYLLERYEVSYAPSATVLTLCQGRPTPEPRQALVIGVPDPSIPAVAAEVEAVAARLSEATVRLGEQATMAALRRDAPGRQVLHLACHGLFRADNPMFSALKLHDGWLMASEAMQLDLRGAMVVLSACESGRSRVIGGDEVLGLTRAFLGAGAASVMVSLWLVQDETTVELMARWYEYWRQGMERAAALRAAQLALMARYPHPYYWAPFVLVGQR